MLFKAGVAELGGVPVRPDAGCGERQRGQVETQRAAAFVHFLPGAVRLNQLSWRDARSLASGCDDRAGLLRRLFVAPPVVITSRRVILPGFARSAPIHRHVADMPIHKAQQIPRVFETVV